MSYAVAIANNLVAKDGSATNTTETANTVNSAWRTITVRDVDPVAAHPKCFIRLNVHQSP